MGLYPTREARLTHLLERVAVILNAYGPKLASAPSIRQSIESLLKEAATCPATQKRAQELASEYQALLSNKD